MPRFRGAATHLWQLPLWAAEASPDAPALVCDGATLSYAALVHEAAQVAGALRALGIRPRDRVALLAAKGTPATTAALYGILWAGCAYVPLDPHAPPARHATITRDAQVAAILGDTRLLAAHHRAWRAASADSPPPVTVVLDEESTGPALDPAAPEWRDVTGIFGAADLARMTPLAAPQPGTEHDLAYLLYTSGSTGTPKGVMHTHRSALSFALWAAAEFGLSADDRVANHAPLHFDLSTFDYFATAAAGAAVYPVPARDIPFPATVATRMERDRHSVVYATPSTWTLMMTRGGLATRDLSSLRIALYAGEVFPTASLRQFLALLPRAARCWNLYGPTETNVCTFAAVTEAPADGEPSNIGAPCPNIEACVIDEDGTLVATGAQGELCIRGGTVMQGYWGDPERTARTLPQDPRHDTYPDRVYRTGDIVAACPDGTYTFFGRRDHQVKIRGFRVELGEIEAVLAAAPRVSEAVVIARPDAQAGAVLHAFVVGPDDLDTRGLQRACAAALPPYMLPAHIERRDSLPRNSSGKIDRLALAAACLEAATPSSTPFSTPQSPHPHGER